MRILYVPKNVIEVKRDFNLHDGNEYLLKMPYMLRLC